MYENNNQGEKDLTPARVAELKAAGWAVPFDSEAVEDGARNIRLNADKADLAINAAARAVESNPSPAALDELTRRLSTAEGLANSAIAAVREIVSTYEGRIAALESRPLAPAVQETGWRNITALISEAKGLGEAKNVGFWAIRRVGSVVEVIANGIVTPQQLDAPFPHGFSGRELWNRPGNSSPIAFISNGKIRTYNLINNNSSNQGFRSLWTTEDAFPTDLPGQPL